LNKKWKGDISSVSWWLKPSLWRASFKINLKINLTNKINTK